MRKDDGISEVWQGCDNRMAFPSAAGTPSAQTGRREQSSTPHPNTGVRKGRERDRGMRKRDIPFSFTAGTRFVINPQAFPHFTSSPSISVMVPVSSNPYVNTIHLRPKLDPYSVSYFAGVCYLVWVLSLGKP